MKRNTEDRDNVDSLVKKQKLVEKKWPDEMTPDAARRIEKLQEQWRSDSEKSQRVERTLVHPTLDYKPKNQMVMLHPRETKPLTVKEAKQLDQLQDKLKREFEHSRSVQVEEKRELEKTQEPIVKAIKEQTATIKPKPHRVRPEPFRPRASSTPGRSKLDVERNTPLPEEEEVFELPEQPSNLEEMQSRSIRQFTEGENIGYLARESLRFGTDRVFGVYYDFENNSLAIGSEPISIEGDDIILNNTMDRYVGTRGLWKLLTLAEIPGASSISAVGASVLERLYSVGAFTLQDYNNYRDIMVKTNAMYRNNDPKSRRPKSSGGWKWVNLLSDMWRDLKPGKGYPPMFTGKGLLVDTNNPVEYRYIDDVEKLSDRLRFIQAEEAAGNNNFHNEKLGIVKFLSDEVNGGRVYRTNLGLASDRKKYVQLLGRR